MNRRAFRYCVRHAKMDSGYYNRNKSSSNSGLGVFTGFIFVIIFIMAIASAIQQ
jgi:hypothetical protein